MEQRGMEEMYTIRDGSKFEQEFRKFKQLGEGADGKVTLWNSRKTGQKVALKQPKKSTMVSKAVLMNEVENMKKLGSHPHIIKMMGWDEHFSPIPPVIFYEYCDLGDMISLMDKIHRQIGRVPEATVWKFIMDMGKGLDWIHNQVGKNADPDRHVSYVHDDLKPGNILVKRPPGEQSTLIPLLPIFKIADVSRLLPYNPSGPVVKHTGTPEYSPSHKERYGRVTPGFDIYAIGASAQHLALRQMPVQSLKKFNNERMQAGMDGISKEVYYKQEEEVRHKIPVMYRPINVSKEEQKKDWDVVIPVNPYSDALNDWYSMCLEHAPNRRISADVLTKWYIPLAEEQIELLEAQRRRDEAKARVTKLKVERTKRKLGIESRAVVSRRPSNAPSRSSLPPTAPLAVEHGPERTRTRGTRIQLPLRARIPSGSRASNVRPEARPLDRYSKKSVDDQPPLKR